MKNEYHYRIDSIFEDEINRLEKLINLKLQPSQCVTKEEYIDCLNDIKQLYHKYILIETMSDANDKVFAKIIQLCSELDKLFNRDNVEYNELTHWHRINYMPKTPLAKKLIRTMMIEYRDYTKDIIVYLDLFIGMSMHTSFNVFGPRSDEILEFIKTIIRSN